MNRKLVDKETGVIHIHILRQGPTVDREKTVLYRTVTIHIA